MKKSRSLRVLFRIAKKIASSWILSVHANGTFDCNILGKPNKSYFFLVARPLRKSGGRDKGKNNFFRGFPYYNRKKVNTFFQTIFLCKGSLKKSYFSGPASKALHPSPPRA